MPVTFDIECPFDAAEYLKKIMTAWYDRSVAPAWGLLHVTDDGSFASVFAEGSIRGFSVTLEKKNEKPVLEARLSTFSSSRDWDMCHSLLRTFLANRCQVSECGTISAAENLTSAQAESRATSAFASDCETIKWFMDREKKDSLFLPVHDFSLAITSGMLSDLSSAGIERIAETLTSTAARYARATRPMMAIRNAQGENVAVHWGLAETIVPEVKEIIIPANCVSPELKYAAIAFQDVLDLLLDRAEPIPVSPRKVFLPAIDLSSQADLDLYQRLLLRASRVG